MWSFCLCLYPKPLTAERDPYGVGARPHRLYGSPEVSSDVDDRDNGDDKLPKSLSLVGRLLANASTDDSLGRDQLSHLGNLGQARLPAPVCRVPVWLRDAASTGSAGRFDACSGRLVHE
jgi:hypothetical protein